MEMNIGRTSLAFCETVFDGNVEQTVDSDITLPDYCKDIARILKCSITTSIQQVQTTGNRITAEGVAFLRLCYASEENELCSFEQSYPFTKYTEVRAMPETPVITVRAKTEYVNCRAVSPRRVDVHGSVSLNFRVSKISTNSIVSDCVGEGVEVLKRPLSVCTVAGCTQKSMPLSEVGEIPQAEPAVKSILRTTPIVRINDVKAIGNKVLIKGELSVLFVYCGENGEISRHEHVLPISQIAELDGADDGCVFNVEVEPVALDIQLKADSNGEMRLFDINAKLCAVICAYKDVDASAIEDSYALSYGLVLERNSVETMRLADSIEDSFVAESELDFTGCDVSQILDAWCYGVSCVPCDRGAEMRLGGTLTLCILYCDSEGQLGFAERQYDYKYVRPLKEDYRKLSCKPFAVVNAVNVSGSGSVLRAKAEISVSATVFACGDEKFVTEISEDASAAKSRQKSAMTLYFTDAGENIWNIAKKYNTTSEQIMSSNGLSDKSLDKKTMLIITRN